MNKMQRSFGIRVNKAGDCSGPALKGFLEAF